MASGAAFNIANVTADSLALFAGVAPGAATNLSPEEAAAQNRLLEGQFGYLQQQPKNAQAVVHHEGAAKYLPALVEKFKEETFIMGGPSALLNLFSYTPYFVRYMKTPPAKDVTSIFAVRIASLTDSSTASLSRNQIAEIGQFFATLLVLQGQEGISAETRKGVVARFKKWSRTLAGTFAADTSERCLVTLDPPSGFAPMLASVRNKLEMPLKQCGATGCDKTTGGSETLLQCSRCKTAVYCSTAHQKTSWSEHKRICFTPTF